METTIICPGCEAELQVLLNEAGWAYGRCSSCEEPIEVIDGEVYDPFAEDGESW